jgi:hypothetical protein
VTWEGVIRSKVTALSVLSELWSWAVDRIEYAITSARLTIVDKVCGPEPPTQADRQREAVKEELRRAFPAIDLDRRGPKP